MYMASGQIKEMYADMGFLVRRMAALEKLWNAVEPDLQDGVTPENAFRVGRKISELRGYFSTLSPVLHKVDGLLGVIQKGTSVQEALHEKEVSRHFASDNGLVEGLVRIAAENPETRKHLVPLLKTAEYSIQYGVEQFVAWWLGMMKVERPAIVKIDAKWGGKYIKLGPMRERDGVLENDSGVAAFIDIATGDILKPASWAAPAKGVRGNIYDKGSWKGAVTAYGAAYRYR